MTPSDTAELHRLRRENRELREELEEWQRSGRLMPVTIREQQTAVRQRAIPLQLALKLTPQESWLLLSLFEAAGEPVSSYDLFEAISTGDPDFAQNLVKVVMSRVRVKLSRSSIGADAIITIWGHGYKLTPEAVAKIKEVVAA